MTDLLTEPRARRTQKERSRDMRKRLIDAAIRCLDEDGYANTSISRIVEVAGVSRGAHLHHFPSKDLLMKAVAEDLMRAVYVAAGRTAMGVEADDDRFAALVHFMWREVVHQRTGRVMLELLNAARADRQLADHLRPLAIRGLRLYRHAADHYFEPAGPDGMDPKEIVFLVQWTLRGILLDAPLVRNPEFFERQVAALIRVLAPHIRNKAVDGPPPRIADWDRET
ncbi:MAG: TetR/AcrR family transcriptional regulator [Pseudomonadota bacterium]